MPQVKDVLNFFSKNNHISTLRTELKRGAQYTKEEIKLKFYRHPYHDGSKQLNRLEEVSQVEMATKSGSSAMR